MACSECSRLVGTGLKNRALRREMKAMQRVADQVFSALCESAAAQALGELWGSGEFECGPQDYVTIVETCLTALRDSRKAAPNLMVVSA